MIFNKNRNICGHLRLVYSCYYEIVDGKIFESLLTTNTENDTITLFDNKNNPKYVFSAKSPLFCKLLIMLNMLRSDTSCENIKVIIE
jgi:hypothetical protein